jgi:signal transduction histidine kinase/ActR/RegA family two-component response regulator/HAMP domain-containing protein
MSSQTSIRRKLTTIILLTCSIVLLLACLVLFAYQHFAFRQAAVRNLTTLGQVIASNSTAALAFVNTDDAQVTLAALRAEPQVVAAALYDMQGQLFAKYPDTLSASELPASLDADGYRFVGSQLVAFQPVIERSDKRLGTLYLQSNTQSIAAASRFYALVVALVIAGSLLIGYAISTRLQREVSQPILALAETAADVSERGNYSVRATKVADDEVGQLTDAFNHMLTRIHAQLGNLDLLQQITRAIAERQDMPSIFKVVLCNLEDSMPIDFGCILLYDSLADLVAVKSIGVHSEPIARHIQLTEKTLLPIDRNGLSRCVRGTLVYEPDIQSAQFPFAKQLARGGMRSLVCAPLLVESKVFGILVAARRQPGAFSSGDCEFLKQLSEHVALAAHQTQLHSALQQAYDDLRQSQHTAMQQERLRALGQMASGIAHDINNAISPVALYTESLLERETNLSERARGYLTTIRQAIDDVAETVARMREFYRHREPQLQLAAINLNELAQQVIDLTRARWSTQPQESGISIDLRTEFAAELPKTMGAEGEVRDALTNLIFNAVDAMPEGGTITVRTKVVGDSLAKTDALEDTIEGRSVAIEIADTGLGMDGETRQRCLEPFFTTKGERGTGLGLAMVYGMVQRHSADLDIDSVKGKGTVVRLTFPVATPVFTATTRFPAPKLAGQHLRILIVDDDPLLIRSLRDILESDNHTVTAADGGQSGIDSFMTAAREGIRFNIVITDLGMPYVDGRKVAATIKGASPTTPVVMLTGWGQRLLADNDIPEHVDRVLSKPPRIHELRLALAELGNASQAESML